MLYLLSEHLGYYKKMIVTVNDFITKVLSRPKKVFEGMDNFLSRLKLIARIDLVVVRGQFFSKIMICAG